MFLKGFPAVSNPAQGETQKSRLRARRPSYPALVLALGRARRQGGPRKKE
eukprot:COSAG06_NODE_51173_length_312_cov_0.311628_1_plen_49_part_10